MIRELSAVVAVATVAVGMAATAAADAHRYDADVPGMAYGVRANDPCGSTDRFVFARGQDGQALICRGFPNQFNAQFFGAPSTFWVVSYPLYGVQPIGAPCPGSQAAAQSPDGRPLLCLGARGWQPGWLVGGAGPYVEGGFVPAG